MKLRIFFSLFLLVVLIYVVSRAVDISQIQKIIFDFPKDQLTLFFSLSFIISSVKAVRFFLILKNSKVKVSFWEAYRTSLAGSAVTPLPGGEAFRAVLLKHEAEVKAESVSGPIILQAYLELFSAVFLALLGSLIYRVFRVPIGLILLLILFFGFLLINKKFAERFFKKLPRKKILLNLSKQIKGMQKNIKKNFIDSDSSLPDKILVNSFILSLIAHILGGLLVFIIARSYQVNLSFFESIFVYTVGVVIAGVGTLSPGGLGFTEGGMSGLMLFFKVGLPKTIAIVLMFRFCTLIFNVIIGAILLLFFYRPVLFFRKVQR